MPLGLGAELLQPRGLPLRERLGADSTSAGPRHSASASANRTDGELRVPLASALCPSARAARSAGGRAARARDGGRSPAGGLECRAAGSCGASRRRSAPSSPPTPAPLTPKVVEQPLTETVSVSRSRAGSQGALTPPGTKRQRDLFPPDLERAKDSELHASPSSLVGTYHLWYGMKARRTRARRLCCDRLLAMTHDLMPSVDRRRVCLGRKPNKGRRERKMIYLMPIDECPHCRARTPRIEGHRCTKVEQNGRFGDKLAAEHQTWIASQLATAQSRSPEQTTDRPRRGDPRRAYPQHDCQAPPHRPRRRTQPPKPTSFRSCLGTSNLG